MASRPQPLSVQNEVEKRRKNNKLKTASAGRKNGEPLIPLPMNRTRKLLEMNETIELGSRAQGAIKVRGGLPMNRTRKLLEMNETIELGSRAQGAIKVRGGLTPALSRRERENRCQPSRTI